MVAELLEMRVRESFCLFLAWLRRLERKVDNLILWMGKVLEMRGCLDYRAFLNWIQRLVRSIGEVLCLGVEGLKMGVRWS